MNRTNYICHHTDSDGYCAASLVSQQLIYSGCEINEIELVPCNYGFKFDSFLEKLREGDKVYIVDFSFEPEIFKMIVEKVDGKPFDGQYGTKNVVWYDHHISAIEKYQETGWNMDLIPGVRSTEGAGCQLVYRHFVCAELKINHLEGKVVNLVGDWDTWSFKYGEETKCFNAGSRLYDTRKVSFWIKVFHEEDFFNSLIENGKTIMKYQESTFERIRAHGMFEFTDSLGRSWVACNSAQHTSKIFGEGAEDKYDFMLIFSYVQSEYWTYSIYSGKYDTRIVDFDGHHSEGHPGASGFQSESCLVDKTIGQRIR